ncbi:hypothetical protein MTOK_15970 [Mycolicibacterium tokaiense]|nr:hypothetical protein MTOK_15970 [Mycolicibacterium tokaiense]
MLRALGVFSPEMKEISQLSYVRGHASPYAASSRVDGDRITDTPADEMTSPLCILHREWQLGGTAGLWQSPYHGGKLGCMPTTHSHPALLIVGADRTVPITVQRRSHMKPADAMAFIAPIDLTTIFKPLCPFPGVAGVENQIEAWDHSGPSRNPQFTDGSQVDEQLTEWVEGTSFAYQLTNFTNALSKLAEGVRGEWTFTPDGEGTLIRWSYEFKPLAGRRWIIAGPFKPLWARYMRAALRASVSALESRAAPTTDGAKALRTQRRTTGAHPGDSSMVVSVRRTPR